MAVRLAAPLSQFRTFSIVLPFTISFEREREREKKVRRVVRDTTVWRGV
jgi:hypothetical protein